LIGRHNQSEAWLTKKAQVSGQSAKFSGDYKYSSIPAPRSRGAIRYRCLSNTDERGAGGVQLSSARQKAADGIAGKVKNMNASVQAIFPTIPK